MDVLQQAKSGWIEVICGSMFSGKTEELIRRIKRAELAKMKVEIFKPVIDTRYHEIKIVSHEGREIISSPVNHSSAILLLSKDAKVVGIDEAQFFDDGLPEVCQQMANEGKRVIVAGLDLDYRGRPFGCMPHLMAIAEYVTKVHAICLDCGQLAYVSYRKTSSDKLVHLGESDIYMPLCRSCYNKRTSELS